MDRQDIEKFNAKLKHSIDLLQKAEKIAMSYDKEDGYWLAFSGGKDSQALYHVAKIAGVKFKAHFSPTTVDPPEVIRFIRQQYPDVEFEKVSKSIFQVAVEKKILPTQRVRWCCNEFKENAGAGKVTLLGVRKKESARRAKRNEVEVSGKKFSGDMEGFKDWRLEQYLYPTKRGRKPKDRKPSVADIESVDRENITGCIKGKDSILISPIIEWNEEEVWYFLNEVVKVPHCKLYDEGFKRIGCVCCPMSSNKQKLKELDKYPHVKRNWINAIKKIRMGGGITRQTYIEQRRIHSTSRPEILGGVQVEVAPIKLPTDIGESSLQAQLSARGFLDSPSLIDNQPIRGGQSEPIDNEQIEDIIAENIFDWWISGKSYKSWYNDKFLQTEIPFDFDE